MKLSYDHAQSMIEAPEKLFSADELPPVDPLHPIDEIHQAVVNLHSIAKNLRAQRFSGGALRLDQVGLMVSWNFSFYFTRLKATHWAVWNGLLVIF